MATVTRLALNSALPTVIAREFLRYTMPRMKMKEHITNAEKWSGVNAYGAVIQVPTFLTRPSVTQQNTGSDSPWTGSAESTPPSVTFSAPTISSVTLVIDQWWYYAFQRTVYADAINNGFIDWDAAFKKGGMDGLAVKIDGTLTNLLAGLTTNVFGEDGSPPQPTDFTACKKALDALDVPDEDRAWFMSSNAINDITLLETISNQLYVGTGASPVVTGKIARPLWGSPAEWTTNLTAGTAGKVGGYFHKQAFGFAMRREPMAFPSLDNPNTLSREIPMFAVWGLKMLRNNFGCYFAQN